jgi:enterochelin esterase family protein
MVDLAAMPSARDRLVDNLWEETSTPLIEAGTRPGTHTLTYLWRDGESADVLIGINRVTHDAAQSRMNRIEHTDVWWASYVVDSRWRGSYSFLALGEAQARELDAMDGRWVMRAIRERGVPDPLNPSAGYGRFSVAEAPQSPDQPWRLPAQGNARGRVTEHVGPEGRTIWVYESAGSTSPGETPCLIMLDGEIWHSHGDLTRTLDRLIANDRIPPTHAFLVDARGPERHADLAVDGTMNTYVADSLLDWIHTHFAVSRAPLKTIVAGQSLGGLTALRIALDRPDRIGAAISQSASLWQESLLDRLTVSDDTSPRIYLEVGINEPVLLEPHRAFARRARELGLPVEYTEFVGGHDYACWRGGVAEGLVHILGEG